MGRRYLNPHVGFKVGYGHEQGHHLVFGAALGLELVRFKYAFMNLKAEGLAWVGQGGLDWTNFSRARFCDCVLIQRLIHKTLWLKA